MLSKVLFGDTFEKWGTWQNGISATLFVVLNHFQIITLIRKVNLVMPSSAGNTLDFFSVASDITVLFRPGCAGIATFQRNLILKSVMPGIVMLAFFATWLLSLALARAFCCERLRVDRDRTINAFLSLMFTFFAGTVNVALVMFVCGRNPNGKNTLIEDRSVICFEREWEGMLAVGLLAVVCWCVGFLAIVIRAVIMAPRWLTKSEGVQKRYKFVFIKYRLNVHWWALVFLAKGVLLSVGFLFIETGMMQLFWIGSTVAIYFATLATFRPWRHKVVNIFDGAVHLLLTLQISLSTYFAASSLEDSSHLDGGVTTLALICSLLVMPLAIALACCMVWKPRWLDSLHSSRAMEGFSEAVDTLAEDARLGSDNVLRNLGKLQEWDSWYLIQARNILLSELLERGLRSDAAKCSVRSGRSLAGIEDILARLDTEGAALAGEEEPVSAWRSAGEAEGPGASKAAAASELADEGLGPSAVNRFHLTSAMI
mmetsp:Transcript_29319/g.84232  ORF Transcript_29319/g.84232 Transcript_29319/m.84232 type:complete len:484 (-) Transcript_29319:170-1621(-)